MQQLDLIPVAHLLAILLLLLLLVMLLLNIGRLGQLADKGLNETRLTGLDIAPKLAPRRVPIGRAYAKQTVAILDRG